MRAGILMAYILMNRIKEHSSFHKGIPSERDSGGWFLSIQTHIVDLQNKILKVLSIYFFKYYYVLTNNIIEN